MTLVELKASKLVDVTVEMRDSDLVWTKVAVKVGMSDG
jgi:hypothetical protein